MAVHAKFGRTKRRRGRDIDGSNPNVGRSCPLLGGSPKRQIYASDTGGGRTEIGKGHVCTLVPDATLFRSDVVAGTLMALTRTLDEVVRYLGDRRRDRYTLLIQAAGVLRSEKDTSVLSSPTRRSSDLTSWQGH